MKQFEDKVLGYLDGSLDDASRSELLHVLSVSPEKRALLDEHIRLQDALKAAHRPLPIPAFVERDLALRIPTLAAQGSFADPTAAASAVTRFSRWHGFLAVLAASLSLVLTGVLLQSPKNSLPTFSEYLTVARTSNTGAGGSAADTAISAQKSSANRESNLINSGAGSQADLMAASTESFDNASSSSIRETGRQNSQSAFAKSANLNANHSGVRSSGSSNELMKAGHSPEHNGLLNNDLKGNGLMRSQSAKNGQDEGLNSITPSASADDGSTKQFELQSINVISPIISSGNFPLEVGGSNKNVTLTELRISENPELPWRVAATYRGVQNFSPVLGSNTYEALGTAFFPGISLHYNVAGTFGLLAEAGLGRLPQFSRTITLQPDPVQPNLTRQVYSSGLIERTGVQVAAGASVRLFSIALSDLSMEFGGGASILGRTVSPLLMSALTTRIPLAANLEFGAAVFAESNWVRPVIDDPTDAAGANSVGVIRDHYQPRTIWVPGVGAKLSLSFHP